MTEKDYCSQVCKAQCCKTPWLTQSPCPMLGRDCLCPVYDTRIGRTWETALLDGRLVRMRCGPVVDVLDSFPEEIRQQCCYHNPDLLT